MKKVYGVAPYFKQGQVIETHEGTADKLVEMGRATEKPEKGKAEKGAPSDKSDKASQNKETK